MPKASFLEMDTQGSKGKSAAMVDDSEDDDY
jgi:hypothetical protein